MPFSKNPGRIGDYSQKAGSNNDDSMIANGLEIIYGGQGNDILGISDEATTYSSILVGGNGSDEYRIKGSQFGIIADLRGDNGYDKLVFGAHLKSLTLFTIDHRHLVGIDQANGAICIIVDMFTPHFGRIEVVQLADQSFTYDSIYSLWRSGGLTNYKWEDVDGILFDVSLAGLNTKQLDNYIQTGHENLSLVVNRVQQEPTPKEENTPEENTANTIIIPTIKSFTFNDYGDIHSDRYKDLRHLGDSQKQNFAGSENNDFIELKDGDDIFSGGLGKDRIYGNKGNDQLYGNDDNDYIFGNMGDDLIFGGTGDDKLYGNLQNDNLHGGAGADSLYGGRGNDSLQGGDGNDWLTGNLGDDNIGGNAGADKIYGHNGNDKLFGNRGDDIIYGGQGDDYIRGNLDDDSLYGGLGEDSMEGGDGNDVIIGGAGADTIQGGKGQDSLNGWKGNDIIIGGKGKDTLTGGIGRDHFIMTDVVVDNAISVDKITDFQTFSVSKSFPVDGIGNYSATNLETLPALGDLNAADDQDAIAIDNLEASVTRVAAAYDLGTSGTGHILALDSSTAFTNETAAEALETGGALALTMNNQMDAKDGIIVLFDNNWDTFVGLLTTSTNVADGTTAQVGSFTMTTLTTLSGLPNAGTFLSDNFLNFLV